VLPALIERVLVKRDGTRTLGKR